MVLRKLGKSSSKPLPKLFFLLNLPDLKKNLDFTAANNSPTTQHLPRSQSIPLYLLTLPGADRGYILFLFFQ